MSRSETDSLIRARLDPSQAGEDLQEDDDDDEDDDSLPTAQSASEARAESSLTRRVLNRRGTERAPLLGNRSMSTSRVRRSRVPGEHGDATVSQAVLMLLKGFVGTGVLFLAKA